ncbi:MAG: DNA repair protein RadC [Spirochaetales bacterium]|nr:DNA repair protein RadC [Spirochaetales bacterium]
MENFKYSKIITTKLEKGKGPREKLLTDGPEILTEQELLAIIIGSGTKGNNVLKLAQTLLEIAPLQDLDLNEIQKIKGIGSYTAARIAATLEIGKRMHKKNILIIDQPVKAIGALSFIARKQEENFVLITLNGGNQIIKTRVIFKGTLNRSIVHPREIFALALQDRAAGIIVSHNHPSGNCAPSGEDINITKIIKDSSKIMGIQLIDHIIISENSYFSFIENELI